MRISDGSSDVCSSNLSMKARRKNKAKNKRGFIRSTLIIGLSAVLLYQLGLFIMFVWFNFHNPRHSAFMRATLNELRTVDSHARLKQKWVPYDQISKNLKRAEIGRAS